MDKFSQIKPKFTYTGELPEFQLKANEKLVIYDENCNIFPNKAKVDSN